MTTETLKVGKLYSYYISRQVYGYNNENTNLGTIQPHEPFVLLEIKKLKWVDEYKVITSQGVVGYIQIGYPYPDKLKCYNENR